MFTQDVKKALISVRPKSPAKSNRRTHKILTEFSTTFKGEANSHLITPCLYSPTSFPLEEDGVNRDTRPPTLPCCSSFHGPPRTASGSARFRAIRIRLSHHSHALLPPGKRAAREKGPGRSTHLRVLRPLSCPLVLYACSSPKSQRFSDTEVERQ